MDNEASILSPPQSGGARLPHQRAWRTLAPVWQTNEPEALSPAQVEHLRPRDLHTDRNSDAEYAFNWMASRFQRYAEQYLFANERLLTFVPWSAVATESWRQRLGRRLALTGRAPREGALVITDRQVGLLSDAAEVAGGGLAWGYVVRVTTPERLTGVHETADPRGLPQLQLELRGSAGAERLLWAFPEAARQPVHDAALLLAGFLPQRDDCRLRRVGDILPQERLVLPPPRPGRQREHEPLPLAEGVQRQLEASLEQYLSTHPDPGGTRRRCHAVALVAGGPSGSHVMAVTQAELIHVELTDALRLRAQPLAEVTSVELRGSVLGWHIAWTAPGSRTAENARVAFPIVAAESCLAVFTAMRQALTLLPIEAEGLETSGAEAPPRIPGEGHALHRRNGHQQVPAEVWSQRTPANVDADERHGRPRT